MMTPGIRILIGLCVAGMVSCISCSAFSEQKTESLKPGNGPEQGVDRYVQDLREKLSSLLAEKDSVSFAFGWNMFISEKYGVSPFLNKGGVLVAGHGLLIAPVDDTGDRKSFFVQTPNAKDLKEKRVRIEGDSISILYYGKEGLSKLHAGTAEDKGLVLIVARNDIIAIDPDTTKVNRTFSALKERKAPSLNPSRCAVERRDDPAGGSPASAGGAPTEPKGPEGGK